MDPRFKNAFAAVGMAALVIISMAALTGANAFSRSAPAYSTISVSGQGKSVGTPDVAEFSFAVVNEGGKDIGTLQKDNIAKVNGAIDFVKSKGVEAKDIETLGYDIEPRYQSYNCSVQPASAPGIAAITPQPCPPASIVGYTITQKVQVKVRDFSKIGDLLSGVATKGANNVSGLNFAVDNTSQLQNEARGKAIQDAKQQAEAMARSGGFHLGRLVNVQEGGNYVPAYSKSVSLQSNDAAQAGNPAPVIEPGSQEVSTQITLTYEIN